MKKQPKTEEVKVETVKTFTQEEVNQLLEKNKDLMKDDLRKEVITAMATKQAELKGKLIQAGQNEFMNLGTWEVMKKMSEDMVRSGALPSTDNIYTVLVKLQTGWEMGLKPMEAIKSLYIVNGVLNIFGDAVIRRLKEHGWTIMPYEETADSCKATIKKNGQEYSETFTFGDAEKSGWTHSSKGIKPGWIEGINRRRKLRYGAISTLIKTYVPEVLGAASEIAEIAEDTIPLYQKKNHLAEATATDQVLSSDKIQEINSAKTKKELLAICGKIKKEQPGLVKAILNEYTQKLADIENEQLASEVDAGLEGKV